MPVTKSDIPALLLPALRTEFFEALDSMPVSDYQKIASVIPSNSDVETYPWLGQNPAMREFIDERKIKALKEASYELKNKTWEATIGVDRAAIEDDKYGQIMVRVRGLANQVAKHKNELIFNLLRDGFSATCYDGQYFFDSDHSEGDSGTQTNVGAVALTADNLQAGITAMEGIKDDKGKPIGVVPDTLVVGPAYRFTARELLESVYYPSKGDANSGVTNVLAGILDLIVSPHCVDSNYTHNWFLLDTKQAIKPLILQDRVPVEFQAMEADSESGFMRDQYVYGVRARYAGGYGLWQFAYGSRYA